MIAATGLSRLQKWILGILYEDYRAYTSSPDKLARLFYQRSGAPFRIRNTTRAQQAGLSRALRRLEARGLILRQNAMNGSVVDLASERPEYLKLRRDKSDRHNRTTDVKLLEPGAVLAERLTKRSVPKC